VPLIGDFGRLSKGQRKPTCGFAFLPLVDKQCHPQDKAWLGTTTNRSGPGHEAASLLYPTHAFATKDCYGCGRVIPCRQSSAASGNRKEPPSDVDPSMSVESTMSDPGRLSEI